MTQKEHTQPVMIDLYTFCNFFFISYTTLWHFFTYFCRDDDLAFLDFSLWFILYSNMVSKSKYIE